MPSQVTKPVSATPIRLFGIYARTDIVVGFALLACIMFMAVFAPLLTAYDPNAVAPSNRIRPPSASHWFGTDMLGRDLFSRVIYGAQVSLLVGFSVAAISSLAGLAIGLLSGYVRLVDGMLMRVMDVFMAIPPILLAAALTALTQGGLGNVIFAITVTEIPRVSRVIRSVVLSVREKPFIEAARMSGSGTFKILVRHILPNTVPALLVQATYICASAMLIESMLSFIGAGVPSTTPTWGNIMGDGRSIWQVAPHIMLFPALFLSLTILSVNLLGDAFRDIVDPRSSKRGAS